MSLSTATDRIEYYSRRKPDTPCKSWMNTARDVERGVLNSLRTIKFHQKLKLYIF